MGGPEYNYGFNEKSAQMGTLTYQSLTLDTDLAIYQISQITFTICVISTFAVITLVNLTYLRSNKQKCKHEI